MPNSMVEVQKTVQEYLDFVYGGGDHLPECFYEKCYMHSSGGDQHLRFPATVLVGSESPASKGELRQDRFVLIDIAGPNLAYAKVKCVVAPHYYTDYHSLVRDQGKWKIVSKLWADAADPFEDIFPDAKEQEIQISKIRNVMNVYLDGLYEGDVEKHLAPFADGAEIFYTDENGRLFAAPATVFLRESLKKTVSPKQKGGSRHEFIQHIEMSGPYTAVVKLNCANVPAYFTDYLFMVAENDEWRIVSKTTMITMKP